MKITGNYSLDTSPERIWPLIFEPGALLQMLPGCEKIEQVAPDEYRGRIVLRVPAMSGAYDTHVKVLEYREPSFCRLQGDAFGPTGSVRGQASFTLTPAGEGTRIDYQGDAQITGPLAGINSRFAEGVAQTLIRQGLARLPELAAARAPAQPVPPPRLSLGARISAFFRNLRVRLRALTGRPAGDVRT